MTGSAIAAKVKAGIARAGKRTGDGAPLTGSIIRTTGADESTYPPTPGSTTPYACTLLLSNYNAKERDGTLITERDAKATIAADAETDPRIGDKLSVGGKTYSIMAVEALQPGGVVLMWKCQIRSGDT